MLLKLCFRRGQNHLILKVESSTMPGITLLVLASHRSDLVTQDSLPLELNVWYLEEVALLHGAHENRNHYEKMIVKWQRFFGKYVSIPSTLVTMRVMMIQTMVSRNSSTENCYEKNLQNDILFESFPKDS